MKKYVYCAQAEGAHAHSSDRVYTRTGSRCHSSTRKTCAYCISQCDAGVYVYDGAPLTHDRTCNEEEHEEGAHRFRRTRIAWCARVRVAGAARQRHASWWLCDFCWRDGGLCAVAAAAAQSRENGMWFMFGTFVESYMFICIVSCKTEWDSLVCNRTGTYTGWMNRNWMH